MPIHILPEHVVAKIAAGEVVERPASVAKELVENALDAGARTITVEADGGGRRLIRISDDGSGIPAGEVELAVTRHATSKLQAVEDLMNIATLGFRGEALASIAAVSRFTITTRSRDESAGVTLRVEGGTIANRSMAGAPAGTVITVENLFYNVPARLKFLKAEATERRHIAEIVAWYAMAYPAVRFILRQDGREQFRSNGSGELGDVLVEALGLDDFRQMLKVEPADLRQRRPDLPPIQVWGFTSGPALNRANRNHITLFVNGRHIKDTGLAHAVVSAYGSLLPGGRCPVAVLMISAPPAEIDVNVHPAKTEVRFSQPDAVFAAVQRAVRTTVTGQEPAVSIAPGANFLAPGPAPWQDRPVSRPPRSADAPQIDFGFDADLPPAATAAPSQPPKPPFTMPAPGLTPARRRSLPMLRVVGQVGATYIVAEGPSDLYLIDQHTAHTRILFEKLLAQHTAGKVKTEALDGVTIELDRRGREAVERHAEALASLGFALEPFGGSAYLVRTVPDLLAGQDIAEVMRLIIVDLQSAAGEDAARTIAARAGEAAAYKHGRTLDHPAMQALVRELEYCADAKTAPRDGSPTLVHITAEDLAKQFGRK
ncbi:MAG: DNA mismatch repair endonuclease MutL [Anaerolineae bacterium]|nr:DNA mismatch repair endonuclease MutL [Anaerolineae bacterium]